MRSKIRKSVEEIKVIDYQFVDNRIDVVYTRESSKQQAEDGYNIHAQEEKCKEYLKACSDNYDEEKVKVYAEKGYSAKTVDRPVMNEMLELVRAGKIKTIIVQKLDRLARRNVGMAELLELFSEYNVRLITLREGIDTEKAMWKQFIAFYIMIAEIEQDQISERTLEALQYGASVGSYVKGGKLPFGVVKEKVYKENGLHINILRPHPLYWSVVEKIYDMAYHGSNVTQIAKTICELPIMKTNGVTLSESGVEKILSNKIYCGIQEVTDKDTYIATDYKLDFEGCLDEDYWKQVQINRQIHLSRDTKVEYLYHGKIFCECGTHCIVDVSKKKLADGTIKRYKYYVCPCCKKRVSETKIYDSVEHRLSKKYKEMKTEDIQEKQRLKLGRIKALKDDCYKMYADGKISKTTYFEQVEKCENDILKIKARLKQKNTNYNKLDYDARKTFVDNVIKGIKVSKNSIKIEYLC